MKRLALSAALAAVAGCTMPEPPPVRFLPATFADLPGWNAADASRALTAFRASCAKPARALPAVLPLDPAAFRRGLARACAAAGSLTDIDAGAARRFFEAQFRPYRVLGPAGPEGLFTGYYEPEMAAARSKRPGYAAPIYALPPQPVTASRAEIETGSVAATWRVLFWAKDPVDVFTLHIQGSARLKLAEGGFARVSYAGNNGHAYVPIGRPMRERGLLPAGEVTMPAIRAWLRAHPEAGRALMRENPRYIFFRENADGDGPKGQSGVSLTPMASLAVDPAFMPMGLPLWLDAHAPAAPAQPLRLLVIAQDTGSAIKGAVRGDLYWGSGEAALAQAGRMASRGAYYLFLPRD
ncbi:MAG: MltA domain-containing protein [Rhodospirillaceae bacterium]|nr:MltA domain-containing protein [Rhodospirillaceae bacterium]